MTGPVYIPDRTDIVDMAISNPGTTSYLVRGNEPLKADTTFAYDELNAKLKTLITGSNFDLKNFALLDVSIIDDVAGSERSILENEFIAYGIDKAAFDTYFPNGTSWPPVAKGIDVKKEYGQSVCGHPGSIIWYPVQGCTDMANCQLIEGPQYAFFPFIDFLNQLLNSRPSTVIYFHCQHGDDRTSATHAAYMMKYQGISFEDATNLAPPKGAKRFKHPWEPTYLELVKYYHECHKSG